MRIKKFLRREDAKTGKDKWITTVEEQDEDGCTRDTSESFDRPAPVLITALNNLCAPMVAILELHPDEEQRLMMNGLTLTYSKDGVRRVRLHAARTLFITNAEQKLITPLLKAPLLDPEKLDRTDTLPAAAITAVNNLIPEIEEYARGKNRDQQSLSFDTSARVPAAVLQMIRDACAADDNGKALDDLAKKIDLASTIAHMSIEDLTAASIRALDAGQQKLYDIIRCELDRRRFAVHQKGRQLVKDMQAHAAATAAAATVELRTNDTPEPAEVTAP